MVRDNAAIRVAIVVHCDECCMLEVCRIIFMITCFSQLPVRLPAAVLKVFHGRSVRPYMIGDTLQCDQTARTHDAAPLKVAWYRIPETRPCPSYPALCILPKPGGATRFPRPLLIKPDRTFNEIIQGLSGDGKPFRVEAIAQKIKSFLGPAYQGLMLYYLYYHSIGIF